MVRAANTGVTCFVNDFGRVTSLLEKDGAQFTEGVLSGDVAVPTQGGLTFYVRHGELFAQMLRRRVGAFSSRRLRPPKIESSKSSRSRLTSPFLPNEQ